MGKSKDEMCRNLKYDISKERCKDCPLYDNGICTVDESKVNGDDFCPFCHGKRMTYEDASEVLSFYSAWRNGFSIDKMINPEIVSCALELAVYALMGYKEFNEKKERL